MPTAARAIAAVPTLAACGALGGASAGCASVFLQNDTPAHGRAFALAAETQRRQIN